MKEEIRQELARKIAASFEAVRQPERKPITEDERRRRVDARATLLIAAAMKKL
jgi:hypothetical protein